jgi:UDP-N-acetylglucosamine 2-epimerase
MGGYGGQSGRKKGKGFLNTAGNPVKDKNAVEVAEYYLGMGKYVAFLKETPNDHKRADLMVEGANSNTICTSSLAKAVKQIRATISESRWYANKENSKIILLSRHKTDAEGKNAIDAVMEGYKAALRKGILRPNDKVEYWFKKGNKRRIMELNAYA